MDSAGLPGRVIASNLTPDPETGAGNWTDDQFARAIREGIGRDGRALFPMMPYEKFRHMSDEELASVVVYLRSLSAVRNPLPPTEIIFPVKYLIRSVPQPLTEPVPEPDRSNQVKWGEYLVTTAACAECHTPMVGHERPEALAFSGGFHLGGPWGDVASANITPDASGIGYYDEALFIQAVRTGYVKARELNSIMPFGEYKAFQDDELKAMFAYLRTVKAVKHRVDNSLPPTDCKICRTKHGGGNLN
jgi:mono/diheme cytochrome c family protein